MKKPLVILAGPTAVGKTGLSIALAREIGGSICSADSMESHLVNGLCFCGEILDVDGKCGGYNLQWAWSSGHLAGISAAKGA